MPKLVKVSGFCLVVGVLLFGAALMMLPNSATIPALSQAQDKPGPATVVPAEALTPAPTPPDKRVIAILELVVHSSKEGRTETVELRRGRIVQGYAPGFIGFPGPWTAELSNEENETYLFGFLDPRRVHVYGDDDEASHATMLETDASREVVVPLYDRGQDLQVREIVIKDDIGKPVFAALVDAKAGTIEQVEPPEFCMDFSQYSDNKEPGSQFHVGGFRLYSAAGEPLSIVEVEPAVLGLRFGSEGLGIDLAEPAEVARLVVGSFVESEPVEVIAVQTDGSQTPVTTADEGIQEVVIEGDMLTTLKFSGGGGEGTVIEVCIAGD